MSRPEPVSVHGYRSVDGGSVRGGNVPAGNLANLARLLGDQPVTNLQPVDRTTRQSGDQLRPGDGRAVHRRRWSSSPPTTGCADGDTPLPRSVRKPDPVHRSVAKPGVRSADIQSNRTASRPATSSYSGVPAGCCVPEGLFERGAVLRILPTRPGDMRRRRGGVRSDVPSNDGYRQLHRELRSGDGPSCGL